MRLFSIPALIGTIFISSFAHASIITKDVDYNHGKIELRGTVVYDDSINTPQPGILIFPEWWGNNSYAKRRAHEMAEQGYIAFVADMYGVDKVTTKKEQAQEWSKPLYENRTMMRERAQTGLAILKKQPNLDKTKIAAIGFCMGGTVALELARSGENIQGVTAFHAGLKFPDKVTKGEVKAKILVLNGGADPMVPQEDRVSFIEEMQTAGADLQFMQYGGAVHAFTNKDADSYKIPGVAYNEKAEKRSFEALRGFLTEIFN